MLPDSGRSQRLAGLVTIPHPARLRRPDLCSMLPAVWVPVPGLSSAVRRRTDVLAEHLSEGVVGAAKRGRRIVAYWKESGPDVGRSGIQQCL